MNDKNTYLKILYSPGGNEGFGQFWSDLEYINIKVKKKNQTKTKHLIKFKNIDKIYSNS